MDALAPKPVIDISDALTSAPAIASATDRLTTARVLTTIANDVKAGKASPLMQIKGLGAAVLAAKQGIAGIRGETAALAADAATLMAAVQDVRAQIKQAHEDISFEAQTLGNGSTENS